MDRVLGCLALAALIAYLAVIIGFVPAIDLMIVFGGVLVLAILDFWTTLGPGSRRRG